MIDDIIFRRLLYHFETIIERNSNARLLVFHFEICI